MRISRDQLVAGYPALLVRKFLQSYRLAAFSAQAIQEEWDLSSAAAEKFVREMVSLGFFEPVVALAAAKIPVYEISTQGQALANASAARPITRKTADRLLRGFMERVHDLNSRPEYLFRVGSVALFGSMLSDTDRLGDVDLAIELQSKATSEMEFRNWSVSRRSAARAQGRRFASTFEWAAWPTLEIYLYLKAGSRSLSLHEFRELAELGEVRYQVLLGDPSRLAGLISAERP